MKIAVITEDGTTISQHFGRAPFYQVLTVEGGKVIHKELREKLGHAQFSSMPHLEEKHGQPHGLDLTSHNKHIMMAEAIADCEVLLCRGMGRGAYESMKSCNIRPIVTDIESVDDAVAAYLEGNIVDMVDRLH